jgi:HSP20 family protein
LAPWYDPLMLGDPMRDLRAWQTRLERLAHPRPEPWAPPIDIYETDVAYVITVEIPGVPRDQVELAAEDNRLTIHGRRLQTRAPSGDPTHYHLVERGYGTFARSFEFAQRVDIERVSADLSDGVLTITLPKVAPPPARRIDVR